MFLLCAFPYKAFASSCKSTRLATLPGNRNCTGNCREFVTAVL